MADLSRPAFQGKYRGFRSIGGVPPFHEIDYLRGVHSNVPFIELNENWNQKPGINADIATFAAACVIANKDFEVLGTSAVTADVAFRVGGGITLTTHGSTSDSTIILPHLDTNQTAWAAASWLTQKSPRFEAYIETGAAAAQTWWAGLKLTNTPVIATDNDSVYFRFDTTSVLGATKLHFITSRSNVDVDDILSLTVAASTKYRLVIDIDANLKPHIYINGRDYTNELSSAGKAALTTAISLIPYVGILQTAAGAKTLSILPGYKLGRAA